MWFNSNWFCFWDNLTKKQKKEYIKETKISKKWQEFIKDWEAEINK